jgi:ubiquinone biosynthesis protein COQ4
MQQSDRIRPISALLAITRLLRDPQDARQVFRLSQALRGRPERAAYARFASSALGARIISECRDLMATLANRAYLATLPECSFGRAYLSFMAQERLTAEGLAEIAEKNFRLPATQDAGVALYAARMRDMHDAYHVLTGYGRDELGEVCVLAFSYPQQRVRSFRVISWLGAMHICRVLRRAGFSARGVIAAMREAARHGADAAWLPGEDIEALLSEDLNILRTRLNIPPPATYQEVISRLRRETGIFSGPLQASLRRRVLVPPEQA